KEKINGILRLKKDCPAKLEVALNDIRTSVDGDVVQAALKQPLAEEKVAASIKKTGNTPYEFAELDIDMDDDIFLPVQALNVLRRNALE
ncbi:U32 family peptidase, partial [Xanthomonas citri pv. citri]|nr:U32 family peptidase [Xanthomonas citri pv. citri]